MMRHLHCWPTKTRIQWKRSSLYWVVVDSRGYLMLPDCQNMKIRLTPMERSLYILLLRYPEGIPVDDLHLYYDELLNIYLSQTV